jgi:hypothetical protein
MGPGPRGACHRAALRAGPLARPGRRTNPPLDFNPILTIILFIPPRYRGVSDQRLQTRSGERWPGCSAVSEMRH